MSDTPKIRVTPYFRQKGESKVLIRSHSRAVPQPKETQTDGHQRTQAPEAQPKRR